MKNIYFNRKRNYEKKKHFVENKTIMHYVLKMQ
jgi:hypothetical protein